MTIELGKCRPEDDLLRRATEDIDTTQFIIENAPYL
jgi:hypothetical protein